MATLITGGSLIQSTFGPDGKHNLEAVILRPQPSPGQPDWRFCGKCFGMFFNGYPTKGQCPAGSAHEASGYIFMLPHDTAGPGQPEWRFCSKCFGMFFAGIGAPRGLCPTGGEHTPDGYNFVLPYDGPFQGQRDWRYCDKCRGMFYDYPPQGVCPAGGGHHPSGYNFVLPHDLFWLEHYWKATTEPRDWEFGSVIARDVSGPGAICHVPIMTACMGTSKWLCPPTAGSITTIWTTPRGTGASQFWQLRVPPARAGSSRTALTGTSSSWRCTVMSWFTTLFLLTCTAGAGIRSSRIAPAAHRPSFNPTTGTMWRSSFQKEGTSFCIGSMGGHGSLVAS